MILYANSGRSSWVIKALAHELKIDSNADGKTSQITKSDEIKPESKNIELNFKTPQVGELLHHYKYHADMMNGTINITQ